MSTQPSQRGLTWFQALAGQGEAVSGLPASLRAPHAAVRQRRKRQHRGAGEGAAGGNGVAAPMQGTIVKVAVSEGDTVAEGDLVVVLEAMKMEHSLTALHDGTVEVRCAVGDKVGAGTVLATVTN
mgnify:CR=1 FL=1